MSSLYSGNLNAFKAATDRISKMDLVVACEEWYESHVSLNCMWLRIEDKEGKQINSITCSHHDEDVLYSMGTEWLNRMYDQLKDWK